MKKLLILVGVLGVFTLGMAEEATFDVTANVIDDIEVTASTVAFGDIARGTTKSSPVTPGNLKVSGSPNKNIKISFTVNGEELEETMELYKDGISSDTNKLIYRPTIKSTTQGPLTLDDGEITWLTLNQSGEHDFVIDGTLTAGNDIDLGEYKGQVGVKVIYGAY